MKTFNLELLEAEKVDAQGEYFSKAAVEKMIAEFKPGLSVSLNFDPFGASFGTVEALKANGNKVFAAVNLDDNGAELVEKGFELASGGRIELEDMVDDDKGKRIDSFVLTDAALTDKKVK